MELKIGNEGDLFLTEFLLYSRARSDNVMARLDIRLNDEQKFHLDKLSAKSGYSSSEIIRKMIDNVDEVTLILALKKIDDRKQVDIEKIACMKYQNYLLSNLTSNMNQIAHYVNLNKENSDNQKLVKSFEILTSQVEQFKKRLSDKNGNS